MSLQTTDSHRKHPARQRLGASLKQALDNMALEGMAWNDAARAANYSTASMWKALHLSHVQAYLRAQRQVFRASLVDEATFRMRALSRQDDNRAAAVTATAKLMSESDQEHSAGAQRHAPGLVVQIINSPGASQVVPGHDVTVIDASDIKGLTDETS